MKMLIPVSSRKHFLDPRSNLNRVSPPAFQGARLSGRKAFTLIELLVVIMIISILASLLVVGVNKAINFSRQVGVKTEMAQIELALANAARELGNVPYIPSGIILCKNFSEYQTLIDSLSPPSNPTAEAKIAKLEASRRLLQMMFPGAWFTLDSNQNKIPFTEHWDGDSTNPGPMELNADQAWVFFLGGVPYSTGPDGFNRGTNPTVAGGKRKGPFYDFKPTRLKRQTRPTGNNHFTYLDSWEKNNLIVYNNINKAVQLQNDLPSFTPNNPPPRFLQTATKYFNPKGYQIISAGKDGRFGGAVPGVFNGYGDIGDGADDQANFSDSVLAKPVD